MVKNKQDYGDFANIFVPSLMMSTLTGRQKTIFYPKKLAGLNKVHVLGH